MSNLKQITMRHTKITISLLMFLMFFSLLAQENKSLSKSKVAATKKGDLIVCDISKLSETVRIPLSEFTEELQIIKLDDADEALIKETSVTISENYFLVKGNREIPYKLFERKTGKFLNNIGAFGQGPGEYQNVYNQQLDEVNNRIYLLPWNARNIIVYDLKGNLLDPIPLCNSVPKGNFKVDTKGGTLIVSALPFTGIKSVVWQQTMKGELLKSVAPGHLSVKPDFSNEMSAYKEGSNYSFNIFTFQPRRDSIYHYDLNQNKLIPVFTLDFKSQEMPIHFYTEISGYFMGGFAEEKKLNENTSTTQNHRFYAVEKKSLKGSFFVLENDFLGGIEVEWPINALYGEYYVRNVDPGVLKDELEKILKENNKMAPEIKAKVTKLKDSITDNDNNYILYARIKK